MTVVIDANSDSELEIRGLVPSEHAFDVLVFPQEVSSGGTSEDVVDGDATFRDYTGMTVTKTPILAASGPGVHGIIYESLDPAKATVDEVTGQTAMVAGGLTRIKIQSHYYQTRRDVSVSQSFEANSRQFLHYNLGSIAQAMEAFVDAAVAGTVFGSADRPERLLTVAGDQYNPTCWAIAAGVKVYPSSVSNSYSALAGGGCLIHPRFAVVADHYHGSVGSTYTWKGPNNVNHSAMVANYTKIAGDLGLLTLDSDAPETVGIARVLPDNWRDYFTSLYGPLTSNPVYTQSLIAVPYYRRNRNSRATIGHWTGHLSPPPEMITNANESFLDNPAQDQYWLPLVAGDSSTQPCLIHPVDKYLIVLSITGPTAVHAYKNEINAVMDAVVPGATVTDADFSDFEL